MRWDTGYSAYLNGLICFSSHSSARIYSLCTSVSSPHRKIRGKTLSPPFFFYQYSTYKGLELKRLNIENDNLALFWITGFLQSATDSGLKVYNSNYLSPIDSGHHRRTDQKSRLMSFPHAFAFSFFCSPSVLALPLRNLPLVLRVEWQTLNMGRETTVLGVTTFQNTVQGNLLNPFIFVTEEWTTQTAI